MEKLDAEDAIKKHSPTMVLCQWMPPNTDLTAVIRAAPSVREYLLLGEADSGICGDAWLTWGKFAEPVVPASGAAPKPTPPYEADGFVRADLAEPTAHQVCKNDTFYGVGWSKVVSFQRRRAAPAAAAHAAAAKK